jgi:hypothetical protein
MPHARATRATLRRVAYDAETSIDLIHRARAGDAAALNVLVERLRPCLVRWEAGRLQHVWWGLVVSMVVVLV